MLQWRRGCAAIGWGGGLTDGMTLVTGGAGFVGRHLVRRLVERGQRVRLLDVDLGLPPLPAGAEIIEASILDAPRLEAAMAGVEVLYHLAADPNLWARDKDSFHRTNCEGTRAVLDAARAAGVRRIVYTSTETILRGTAATATPIDEDVAAPDIGYMPGPYCRSKFLAERVALDAARAGLPVVVVNPTLPVGPGDWRLTPPTRMIRGYLIGAFSAYLEFWLNLVPVEDLARGHILAAERGRVGERYILGGENMRLSELLAALEQLSGRAMPKRRVPYWLALLTGVACELVADHLTRRPPPAPLAGVRLARAPTIFRSDKARNDLGYAPGSVAEALAREVDWLNEAGFLDGRT